MFDFLDFNDNGHIDPSELFIGASIASSFGYGAGLAEAEHRERERQADYEDELGRAYDRIDELEEELEELRESRFDSFSGDWDDDDWPDDDDSDDADEEVYWDDFLRHPFEVAVWEIAEDDRQRAWLDSLNEKNPNIVCKIEGENPNGRRGIAVYVDGVMAGYLPKGSYNEIEKEFEEDGTVYAFDYEIGRIVDEKGDCIGVDSVWLKIPLFYR